MKRQTLIVLLLIIFGAVAACGNSTDMTKKEKTIIDKRIVIGEDKLTPEEKEIFEKAINNKPHAKAYLQDAYNKHMMRDYRVNSFTEIKDKSKLP